MNKYKLLRFGQCYINRAGDFVIGLMRGDKKHGYTFAASHANPVSWLGEIHMQSRIVPNDGNWIEVSPEQYTAIAAFHDSGYRVEFPAPKSGKLPKLIKY